MVIERLELCMQVWIDVAPALVLRARCSFSFAAWFPLKPQKPQAGRSVAQDYTCTSLIYKGVHSFEGQVPMKVDGGVALS